MGHRWHNTCGQRQATVSWWVTLLANGHWCSVLCILFPACFLGPHHMALTSKAVEAVGTEDRRPRPRPRPRPRRILPRRMCRPTNPRRARPKEPQRRWRWGESNPRPMRFQRRHLRAQPTASFRNLGDAVGRFSWALVGIVLPRRSQRPGGRILHCYARFRRGRHPPGGHAALIRQRVRNFRCRHLWLFPAL